MQLPRRSLPRTPRAPRAALLIVCVLLLAPAANAQRPRIGTLSLTRRVLVTHTPVDPKFAAQTEYAPANQGQGVFAGQGLRTLKRSYAEIAFNDTSLLRVNERTDLVVQEAAALRSTRLNAGSVWIRVARGRATQVETPALTAAARGTLFTVDVPSPELSILRVLEGEVEASRGNLRARLRAGQQLVVRLTANNVSWSGSMPIPPPQRPTELGGPIEGWWRRIEGSRGLLVFAGTDDALPLRSSPLTETWSQLTGLPPDPRDIANDPAARARLLSLSQSSVVPTLEAALAADPGLTLAAYRKHFGNEALQARFPVGGSDLTFLNEHGVRNVDQLFAALSATGGSLGLDLRSQRLPTRALYRPGAADGTPSDFRLFDQTSPASGLFLAGLAAGLALNGGKLGASAPLVTASAFGLTADPQALGGRLEATGLLSGMRYRLEGNIVRLLSDPNQTFSRSGSVASLEKEISPELTLFVGRRRFYHGPVFQNRSFSQLIADRYSAVGATVRRGALSGEFAYLHDANPDVQGAQAGALGSVFRSHRGGLVGVHLLRVPRLRGGTGLSVSGSLPLMVGRVDLYGEVGKGPDKADLRTLGVYLPGLFQSSDIDLFVEIGSHTRIGQAASIIAAQELADGASVRAFVTYLDRPAFSKQLLGGIGASFSFGPR